MKVKDLIQQLSELNPEMQVGIAEDGGSFAHDVVLVDVAENNAAVPDGVEHANCPDPEFVLITYADLS